MTPELRTSIHKRILSKITEAPPSAQDGEKLVDLVIDETEDTILQILKELDFDDMGLCYSTMLDILETEGPEDPSEPEPEPERCPCCDEPYVTLRDGGHALVDIEGTKCCTKPACIEKTTASIAQGLYQALDRVNGRRPDTKNQGP